MGHRSVRLALLSSAAIFSIAFGSAAQAQTHRFDVPAEEAGKSIPEFARQAGIQIVAPGEVLRGVTTHAVKGDLGTDAAIMVLLRGTGLTVASNDGHTVVFAAQSKNVQTDHEEEAANPSQIEEVTVTAQKREQSILDVPMAVTAVRAGELADRGIVDVQHLSYAIPELTVFRVGASASTIMLRGLGISGGTAPVVGVYLDDFAVDATSSRPLEIRPLDLERVEVLYGPQGTLYGQGSEGGTVKYITNNPVFGRYSFDGTIDNAFTEGGAGTQKYTGIGNIPIVDGAAALRIAGTYENDGGWVNAPSANRKDINGNQIYDVRAKGLWKINDAISLTPLVEVERNYIDNTGNGENAAGNIILPPFAPTTVPSMRDEFILSGVTGKFDLGPAELISSTSHFRDSLVGGFTNSFGALYRSFYAWSVNEATNQEFRLQSAGTSNFSWLVGIFYRDSDFQTINYTTAGTGKVPTTVNSPSSTVEKSDSYSYFANAAYKLTSKLEIGGGLRYFSDDKRAPLATTGVQKANFYSTDPRAYISYAVSDDLKSYFSIAKGFRSGGFNAVNVHFPPQFNPEDVYTYELGSKVKAFASRLSGDASLYYSDYNNIQFQVIPTNVGLAYTANAGKARIEGADASFQFEVIDGTSIGAAGDLINTRVLAPSSGAALITGDPLNYIPKYAYNLNAEQRIRWSKDVPGLLRVDYAEKGKSTFILRTSNASATSDTIHMLNGMIRASWRTYRFDVYAENILNDRGRLAPNIVNYAPRAQPLTAGIRLGASF